MTDSLSGRPPLVAVIDDEEDITTFLRLALEDAGLEVVTTNDATQAMELLLKTRPDLVCLDLLMPEQTGISLYSAITSHPDLMRTPIVIFSGLALTSELPEILRRAGNLPAPAGFLEKPINAAELLATVNVLLGRPEGRRP